MEIREEVLICHKSNTKNDPSGKNTEVIAIII